MLIFAYELRATYPKAMSKDQYRMFDQSVRMMLKGEMGGRQGDLPGRAPEGGSGGDGTAQTAPKRGVLTVIDGHTTTERKVRPQRRKPVKGAPAPVVILDRKRSGS